MATKAGKLAILLGQCVPSVKHNASKIRIRKMEFDSNLNMYFKKDSFVFAHDPEGVCKVGDTVLVKELPAKLTRLVTHSIEEVVYRLGDITDPMTGKAVVVGQYRDQVAEANRAFGVSPNAFDYTRAPRRGRLEGERDFTHRETYIKWHEDGKDQPFAV